MCPRKYVVTIAVENSCWGTSGGFDCCGDTDTVRASPDSELSFNQLLLPSVAAIQPAYRSTRGVVCQVSGIVGNASSVTMRCRGSTGTAGRMPDVGFFPADCGYSSPARFRKLLAACW